MQIAPPIMPESQVFLKEKLELPVLVWTGLLKTY